MIYAILGLPGSGKTLYSVKKVIDYLVNTDVVILTNLPVFRGNLAEYLQKHYPEKVINLFERLVELTPEETQKFYLYRDAKKEKLKILGNGVRSTIEFLQDSKPVVYFLDELQNFYNARSYQENGLLFEFYLSQHRHLGDDVYWCTQHLKQVDVNFSRKTQEFYLMRNLSKEMISKYFKAPNVFRIETYNQAPLTRLDRPILSKDEKLDLEICKCYDTSSLGSLKGGNADTKGDRRGGISNRFAKILIIAGVLGLSVGIWYMFTYGGKKLLRSAYDFSKPVEKLEKQVPQVPQVPQVSQVSQVQVQVPQVPQVQVPQVQQLEKLQVQQVQDTITYTTETLILKRIDSSTFIEKLKNFNQNISVFEIDDTTVYIRYPAQLQEFIHMLDVETPSIFATLSIHSFKIVNSNNFDLSSLDLDADFITKITNSSGVTGINLGKLFIKLGKTKTNYIQTQSFRFKLTRGIATKISQGIEIPIKTSTVSQGTVTENITYKPVATSIKISPKFKENYLDLDFDLSIQNLLDQELYSISSTTYITTQRLQRNSSIVLLDLSQNLNSKSTGWLNFSKNDEKIIYYVTLDLE